MDLSTALDTFLLYHENRRGSTHSTIITYKSSLHMFISCVGNMPTASLTLAHIDDYAEKVIALNLKPKSFRGRLATVRAFVKWMYAKELTDIRPESIELPKIHESEPNFLTAEEQTLLIHAVHDLRTKAIILILLRAGLRISELVDMHTDDLFERSIVVRCGKGKKPRVTFITAEAETILKAYLATKPYTLHMFTNERGDKLSRQYVTRIISEAGENAGLHKHISPHTLRHSFATTMLWKGARAEDIQPLMGHVNIATTRLYMHFTNPYLKERYDEISVK